MPPMLGHLTRRHTLTSSWGTKDKNHTKIVLQAGAGARLAELGRPWRRIRTDPASEDPDLIVLPSTSVESPLEMVRANDNPSLSAFISGRTEVDLAATLGIARAITRDLATVHACHLLHGSISVDGILIEVASGSVEIVDFTEAVKLAPGAWLDPTAMRRIPDALARTPEIAGRSAHSIDHRTDLYALGCVLYHLFTGRPVFPMEDPVALAHAHLAKLPSPPHEIIRLPPIVSAIIMALLRKQPEDRYQRAVNLLIDLDICLQDLLAGTSIADFPLRLKTLHSTLAHGGFLYGRDSQRGQLSGALAAAKANRQQRLLVTGAAGVGKSVLCKRFADEVALNGGRTGLGKFEQFGSGAPYLGIIRCFENLIGNVLQEPDEVAGRLCQNIAAKLNGNLGVLAAILPTFGKLMGIALPDGPLSGFGARDRLAQCFLGLLDAIASPDQPVVLFLDDLQWADGASLDILERISADLAGSVVLVGMSRTDRDEMRRLIDVSAALTAQGVPPIRLDLISFNRSDVEDLLLGVYGPRRCLVEAAAIVYAKTLGSPLFVCQFLQGLDDDEVLDSSGVWDVAAMATIEGAADVIDFLSARIASLDDLSCSVLIAASCFGMSFNRMGLHSLTGMAEDALSDCLSSLVAHGFFVQFHEDYVFAHDRVREAAYGLAADREKIHRDIGRHMLAMHATGGLQAAAFTIARHLRAAGDLSGTPRLAERYIEVAFLAAQRAHDAAAFDLARDYAGVVLADTGRWADHYGTMAVALILKAESTVSRQDHDRFDLEYGEDAAHLRTDEHRLKLALVRVMSLHARGRSDEALEAGLDALRIIGIDLPANPEAQGQALLRQFTEFQNAMAERRPSDLGDLPMLSSPCIATAMEILFRLAPDAHNTMRPELFALMAMRNASLMLEHGRNEFTSGILMVLALVLVRLGPDLQSAEDFAQAAMGFDGREGRRTPASVSFIYSYFFSHWTHPLEASLPSNLEGMRTGFAMGEPQFGSFHAAAYVMHLAGVGAPLRDVIRAGCDHERLIARRIQVSSFHCRLEIAFAEALLGMTAAPTCLSRGRAGTVAEVMYEAAALVPSERGFFLARHLQLAYMFGRLDAAAVYAEAVAEILPAVAGNFVEADIVTFSLLTALAAGQRPVRFDEECARLGRWADRNPTNFGCRRTLVAAELASREDRAGDAIRLYGRAIEDAKRHGFVHLAAMASERAGRCLLDLDDEVAGHAHLVEALRLYSEWGAEAKTSALHAEFPMIREVRDARPGEADLGGAASDISTVLAAARSISAEVDLDRLMQKLMTTVQEASGATYGALILNHDGRFFVDVVLQHGEDVIVSETPNQPLDQSRLVPRSVIAQVGRDHATLVLKNTRSSEFARDPYIRENAVVSVLCAPLIGRGKLEGFIYIENNLTVGAFDPRSAQSLQMLAAQAAIALTNARLFGLLDRARADLAEANQDLERKVDARTAELAEAHRLAVETAAEADRARQAEKNANDAKSRLLSVVSHEIRTPMNGMLGMLQLLDRSRLDVRERHQVDLAQQSGFALVRLIDGILDYSRLELSVAEAADEAFDLDELLEGSVEIFRPSAEAKGLALTVRCDAPAGTVLLSDARGIGRVIMNLVGNAVKFTADGSVTVTLSLQGDAESGADRLLLRVEDTGVGVTKAMQERIFEEFVQADATVARRYGGTGLGLAISRQIVSLLGGTIEVESEPGTGSIFKADMPVSRASRVAVAPAIIGAGPPLSVLVVDDDEINREVASGLFQRLGHAVTCAEGWAAAVSAVEAEDFDVIVLDLHMPEVDGLETARRIRRATGMGRCPLMILLTADVTEASRQQGLDQGISSILHKPLRLDELSATLASLPRRQEGEMAGQPQFPAVDLALFAERCRLLGLSQMVRLIRLYDRRSRQTIDAIGAACTSVDRPAVARLAHRLRGASGSLELREMEERARLLETAASAGDVPLDDAVAQLPRARRRSIVAVIKAIRAYRVGNS